MITREKHTFLSIVWDHPVALYLLNPDHQPPQQSHFKTTRIKKQQINDTNVKKIFQQEN